MLGPGTIIGWSTVEGDHHLSQWPDHTGPSGRPASAGASGCAPG
jgi:hypothetical protein